jgi:glucose/arabinose dehydrogenase
MRSALVIGLTSLFLLPAVTRGTPLTTVQVASGLTRPVFVTAPPGDTDRLFIVEQRSGTIGRIKILNLDTGLVNATLFLSVPGVSTGNEQGLLGLAFHPDYASNGYFYVNYTNSTGTTVVARYQVSAADPDVANPAGTVVLTVAQPFSNHNGGWIGFGPDGYLYIALGDGGSANDPGNRAQNLNELLGKMLRIDVDNDDFPADPNRNYAIPADNPFVGQPNTRGEIWHYGLRNPWRDSFDRLTGDLWIGDVGQGVWEEIDFQPASSAGGLNFGWRCMEGNHCTGLTGCTCNSPALTDPVQEYNHDFGCSVTGGYVYRGIQICDLQGTYFYADYCSAIIWSFRYDGSNVTEFTVRTAELDPPGSQSISSITSFGEDAAGELYIVSQDGEIYKVVPADGIEKPDMDLSGTIDFGDINPFVLGITNPTLYESTYGVPPARTGDLDCNGALDFGDINLFVAALAG